MTPLDRPIVASTGSLLEGTSQYINYLLPLVLGLPWYCKDSTDFIRKINDLELDEQSRMITLDVTALYTSIRHMDGINACKYFLKIRSLRFYDHNIMILQMLEFCLKK